MFKQDLSSLTMDPETFRKFKKLYNQEGQFPGEMFKDLIEDRLEINELRESGALEVVSHDTKREILLQRARTFRKYRKAWERRQTTH